MENQPQPHLRWIAKTQIDRLSRGMLFCLPHVRSLLDFFEAHGTSAKPLVVRCVVFGRLPPLTSPLPAESFAAEVIKSSNANGTLELVTSNSDGTSRETLLRVKYRTVGFGHGSDVEGSYSKDGTWTGHLVAVTGNTVLDPTLGQLNHPKFDIDFNPPYLTFDVDEDFLNGRKPAVVFVDGKCAYYQAYPAEQTYEKSRSWSDASYREQLKQVGVAVAKALAGSSASRLATDIGRNDLCHCGSQKKYKKCHGA